jgi:hypothetical protein
MSLEQILEWLLMLLLFSFFLIFASKSLAEPSYCTTQYFRSAELPYFTQGQIKRAHVYKIGSLKLVGLAVGGSDANAVAALSKEFSKSTATNKYCTWYLNQGNKPAEQLFNHEYLPGPYWVWPIRTRSGIANDYQRLLSKHIDQMVLCAEKENYLALGCDGQKHRGPSAFAYLLSVSGCSSESSMKIANEIWGTNHVPKKTRQAIAQKGFEHGEANPALRARLQKVMSHR